MSKKTALTFSSASFIKTAIWPKDYPNLKDDSGEPFIEVGVAGRSNVGKSTLLNHLFRRKNLVKTSSTPGKTQAINFFKIDDQYAFVDLPGYGYAKVPERIKRQWGPMVHSYLNERESLALVLFLLDIRRVPNADDLKFIEWAIHSQTPIVLVLTKVDKVKKNERKANTEKILKTLNLDNLPYVHYSCTKNRGRPELIKIIQEGLG
ncbi:Probable GTP-binding protein EngB [Chlamydiales bacterium SCGC AG-110-M15]|nr:Probable GTP-binding protein EngB [Chlamydiales bacterium SCGC AG-110-M15]